MAIQKNIPMPIPTRLLVLGSAPSEVMDYWLDYYTGNIIGRIEVAGHLFAEGWAIGKGYSIITIDQKDLSDMEYSRVLMGWASHAVLFGNELQAMADGFGVKYKIVK